MSGGHNSSTSEGRKQWIRFTGTRATPGYFDGYGYLAEDGCPDSQVVLAKQLLEEKRDDNADQEQNDRLGVYWLIKASEQGHKEATRMLEKCFATGRGINKHNVGDVKNCLKMSHEEKVSRLAARELFSSLSQGTDFITSEQLAEAMETAQKYGSKCRELNSVEGPSTSTNKKTDWLSEPGLSSEKLTEDMLVSAAIHHSKGELPIVHRVLMLNKKTILERQGSIQNKLFSPMQTIRSSYFSLIDAVGKRPISSFVPINLACLQSLAILTVYSFLGFDGVIEAMPFFFYLTSLILMFIATCQVLTKKWESNQFKQWSNLLIAWGGPEVNADEAQWTHCYNNIYPCFIFLISFAANVVLFHPFVNPHTIPHSELAVVSALCSIITLYNFSWKDKKDWLAILSFGVLSLGSLNPYDSGSVVYESLKTLNVVCPDFVCHLLRNSNPSMLMYAVLFIILISMAARNKWRGIYKTLLPHLISLAWWKIALSSSDGATSFGLVRSSIVAVVAVLIVPLACLVIICLPLIAIAKLFMAVDDALFESTMFGASCVIVLGLFYFASKPSRFGKIAGKIQIALAIFSALLLLSATRGPSSDIYVKKDSLSYTEYRNFCAKTGQNILATEQEKCYEIAGLYVHWEGYVESTKITNVYNPLTSFVYKLPLNLNRMISCMYGEYHNTECDDESKCNIPFAFHSECTLSNWNRYEYEIGISIMAASFSYGKALLKADNNFRNFTNGLTAGDKIWFSGLLVFEPNLEDQSIPVIKLHQSGCLSCKLNVVPVESTSYFSNFLHFFFNRQGHSNN